MTKAPKVPKQTEAEKQAAAEVAARDAELAAKAEEDTKRRRNGQTGLTGFLFRGRPLAQQQPGQRDRLGI